MFKLPAVLVALFVALTVTGQVAAQTGPLLAGRPIRYDGSGNQCQAVAYARVNGAIVLLTANHCRQSNDVEGAAAYTNGGVRIGTWGVMDSSWTNNDLVYIILNSTYRPTTGLNQVYRGSVAGNDFWTITTSPTSADGCAGYVFRATVVHDAQATWDTTTAFKTGVTISKTNHTGGCTIETTIPVSGGTTVDSGSPFLVDQTTVTGIATTKTSNGLVYNPVYQGLDAMNTYFVNLNGTGAWLCQTSTC